MTFLAKSKLLNENVSLADFIKKLRWNFNYESLLKGKTRVQKFTNAKRDIFEKRFLDLAFNGEEEIYRIAKEFGFC